jgi:hypothetical protein
LPLAVPVRAAVIVPALKLPLPSRSTTVEAVFAVAYAIDDVTVVAEAATGNWPVVMPEIAAGPLACGKFCTNGTSTPFEPLLSLVTLFEPWFATQTLPD